LTLIYKEVRIEAERKDSLEFSNIKATASISSTAFPKGRSFAICRVWDECRQSGSP